MSFRDLKMMILMMVFATTSLFTMPSHAASAGVVVTAAPVTVLKLSLMNDTGSGLVSTTEQTVVKTLPLIYVAHLHGIGCGHSLRRSTLKQPVAINRDSPVNLRYGYHNDKIPWFSF